MRYDCEIIWEIDLNIDHFLLSNEKSISEIKEVYSHSQALSQCHNFLKKHNIRAVKYRDTAWAWKMISDKKLKWSWSIWSALSWELYWLNIIADKIQDQDWNTTRFFIVTKKNSKIKYSSKMWKITIIFESRDMPASLYKCLWAFATNSINLTKIESLPALKDPFTSTFWLDFQWKLSDPKIKWTLKELDFFTKEIKILWEY